MNDMMLMALTDPAGAPAHPLIFLVLGVVTFALHLTAVNVMLGTLGLAAWGAFSKNPYWQRLAGALGTTAKVAVSVAIVLGVAPLLFVQVIYDPFWYTSNVISAWWLLGFLAILTVAYLALYRFYGLNHRYEADGRPVHLEGAPKGGVWLAGSLVLMLVCGLIMHAVVNQSLLPAEWMNWYAPNGEIEPYGRSLHSVTPARLLFFLLLSLPVTAGWLFGMRRYLLSSGETDYGYVDFIEGLAHGMARVGSVLVLLAGAAWMATLPETMSWFAGSVWMWIGLVPLAYFGAMSFIQKKRVLCIFCNYMAFGMTLVMTIVLAALREVLRFVTFLEGSGYDALAYKITMDWPSTVIFFTTFLVVGGLNLTRSPGGAARPKASTSPPPRSRAWASPPSPRSPSGSQATSRSASPSSTVKESLIMNIIKTTCAAVLILAAAASQAAPDPAKLSGNPTGEALAGEHFVPLAGMDEGEFITSMKEFRSHKRPSSIMSHIAEGYSDEEFERMARYFNGIRIKGDVK